MCVNFLHGALVPWCLHPLDKASIRFRISVEKDIAKQRFLLIMLGEDMKMLVEDRSCL